MGNVNVSDGISHETSSQTSLKSWRRFYSPSTAKVLEKLSVGVSDSVDTGYAFEPQPPDEIYSFAGPEYYCGNDVY